MKKHERAYRLLLHVALALVALATCGGRGSTTQPDSAFNKSLGAQWPTDCR